MERRSSSGANTVSDETLGCIFFHLDRPADRRAVSQVCLQWKRVDSNTRKCVKIANCYSVSPATLSKRFPNINSLRIKGKPRAFDFDLLVPNWGGYAMPWVAEVARAYSQQINTLWLRRMQVTDADLTLLAHSCSASLLCLRLHKCSGFSTLGLTEITTCCRSLKVLYMEECEVLESDSGGKWLHELALHNDSVEELNFQYTDGTGLDHIDVKDLELLVENCKSLRTLKVNEVDVWDMERVLSKTSTLVELGTGCCSEIGDPESSPPLINFPNTIVGFSGYSLTDIFLPIMVSMLGNLKKLNLQYSLLSQEGHCKILRHCTQLEVLELNGLGDAGLITVSETCKNLRRIRIDDAVGEGLLSPAGIIPLVQKCVKLEFLVMYVSDISNATLAAVGENCTVLKDCRFVLLPHLKNIADLPLDEGVRSLLRGCQHLTRFALYVRHGALTDQGLAYIGEYGGKLRWILLGGAGESDLGLLRLASGCQNLERLELRDCAVTEAGLAAAAITLKNSLKFMWVQGYNATEAGGLLLARSRPYWTVETSPGSLHLEGQVTAYCSLAPPRTDHPPEITILGSGGDGQPLYENGVA